MSKYQTVEAALNSRSAREQRTEDSESQYYHVTCEIPIVGNEAANESIVDVTFPVYFVDKPKHSFGAEILNGQVVVAGAFPTIMPCVIQWDIRSRDDGSPVYSGATIGIVMTGQENQLGQVQFHVEGVGIRQTTSSATDPGDTPGVTTPTVVVPGAPIVSDPTVDVHTITVEFLPPTSTGGSPIIVYTATATSSDGGATKSVTNASSPIIITGLTPSKTYTVTVKATTAAGTGPASVPGGSVVTDA